MQIKWHFSIYANIYCVLFITSFNDDSPHHKKITIEYLLFQFKYVFFFFEKPTNKQTDIEYALHVISSQIKSCW